ncbi:MAG: PD-(D/E)XK nuclease family protein [Muribaculaceae bacterium]|nr:PD-(D/E)XK nuclease family protein [Muribaculaceae bacterium]
MVISEFENKLQQLATQFKNDEKRITDKQFVYSQAETLTSKKITEVLNLGSKAIIFLLDELSTVDGCEKINDLLVKESDKANIEVSTEDGRLDIVLHIGNDKIIIENKIHANDQQKQIARYTKHSSWLFYLTRFGHIPSADSSQSLIHGKDYFCISYYEHIYKWLERLMAEKLDEESTNKIFDLWMWVRLNVKGYPEFFELIHNNRVYIDRGSSETRRLIWQGYQIADETRKNEANEGIKRFCKYIVWSKLIPRLREIAQFSDCELVFDHKFEFATCGGTLKFMHQGKMIAELSLNSNNSNGLWNGVCFKGKLLEKSKWDFETLLGYDSQSGLLEEIESCIYQ